MRPPRHRFSNDVRATTRAIGSQLASAGADPVDSAAQLDAWIARNDDIRERLTRHGYGTAFTAEDLFPLFEAHALKASPTASRRAPTPSPRAATWRRVVILAAVVIAILIAVALAR
ncbi:MAG TPA: hypothetical protein VF111_00255 [Thermoanaerobaculia bacterium]